MKARPDIEFESRLGRTLAELARAERTSAAQPDWTGLAARLERPGLLDRAPAGLASALRGANAFLQPAAAGAMAATIAGLALGTWLALAFQRGAPTSVEAVLYEDSSLVGDDSGGLAASYFALAGDAAAEAEPAVDAGAADSGGAVQ